MTDVGDISDEMVRANSWSDQNLADAGIPVVDTGLATVGGGLGSFAMVDTLRIAGVPTQNIKILTGLDTPSQTYRYLAGASQIPDHERLRSDSASTIDNIWGFPAYALREAASARGLKDTLAPLWNVLTEPTLGTDFYTPRGSQVYRSIEAETERIRWSDMLMKGQVRTVRRRLGGGYFSLLTPPSGTSQTKRIAVRSQHVHVAVGYSGVRFLPDLQQYRETHSDFGRVVNAYEPHDYVYEEFRKRPSTVLIRGSGIVASRILQRVLDDREKGGAQTTVYHLFRNYVHDKEDNGRWMSRPGGDGFAYQGFNYPKAAWGGQLKERFERLDGQGRKELLAIMGGTNTPKRKDWQQQLQRGMTAGHYRQFIGRVDRMEPGDDQTIVTSITDQQGTKIELAANVIIDATGLEPDIAENRVLSDLLDHGGATRNASGRLEVLPSFEVRGTSSDPGRLYASGAPTLGGYYAGVDSFLGLQYAALAIADDLAKVGFAPRIGIGRSVSQWWRWMRRKPVEKSSRR